MPLTISRISFGAVDAQFSDKSSFPSFYRTAPSELSQFAGISELLKYFVWTWVGVVTSEDDSGERAQRQIKKAIEDSGGCVEFSCTLVTDISKLVSRKLTAIISAIRNSTAQVIILHGSGTSIGLYFTYNGWKSMPHKTWIASVTMSFFSDNNFFHAFKVLNGTLAFSTKKGEIIGFRDFLYNVHPAQFPDDVVLKGIWQLMHHFNCTFNGEKRPNGPFLPYCSENETMKSLNPFMYHVFNFRYTYNIYNAVYAFAHALHNMLSSGAQIGTDTLTGYMQDSHQPWKLNRYLKKIHFKNPSGDEIAFDDSGELPAKFDIINWVFFGNYTMEGLEVGSFDSSAPPQKQLVINASSILWHSKGGTLSKVPLSVCSESCLPGYRKAPIKGRPVCCFDCVPCAEGEFSNSTDMENCLNCPLDQWPNERKDGCLHRTIVFLSYSDTLGLSLASLSVVFTITTLGILAIFVQHRDTPIVKANNRDLSYALLISLMLAFLCSLLFIGCPETWTCLIQEAAFGVIFTVAVSCVLAKTSTVVIAFNATKPGSTISRWLGPRASGSMVLLCTLGEVVICVTWLLTSPAHLHSDMVSEAGKIILQCDQGSAIAFYFVLGYMGLLALVSFIVAFLARNLPDRFNEAKLITFSMLVFCSVWVTFVPAYLSTKGRYMVAMEVFAILASSAGLLGCIFIPKCYVVLFRPDINTREHLVVKSHL